MPRLSKRLAISYCIVASLLTVPLWTGGCASFQAVPTAAPATPFGCLVYADQGSNQPVWLLKGSNPPRLLAHVGRSQISPDGRYVFYTRNFPEELWTIGTDGSGEKLLYTAPMDRPQIAGLLLSPDGTMGVCKLTCPGTPSSQDLGALWRLDVPTGTVRQLAEKGAHWPLFSPDGRWLSVASPMGTLVSHGSVGLIDVEGRGDLALFDSVRVWNRAWAADSSGFIVAFEKWAASPAVTELWWIPTSGLPAQLGRLMHVATLSWQPGGGRLVYQKRVGDDATRLYLANRDGSEEVPIPGSEGMYLHGSWSSDGRWLLTRKEGGTFYLVDTDGPSLYLLDVQVVYDWLDANYYLASYIHGEDLERYWRGEDMYIDLYRCAPLGRCELLAKVPPRPASLSYAERCP
jgi:hypothetical protein